MLIDALPEPTPMAQLGRYEGELRYVTQHFKDLQGLKLAPFSISMLMLLCAFPRGHHRARVVAVVIGGTIALIVGGIWFVARWYSARYGFVQLALSRREILPGSKLATILCLVVFAILVIFAHARQPDLSMVPLVKSLFLPQCFFAVPQSGAVRLRRLLYVSSTLAVTGFLIGGAFSSRCHWMALYVFLWSLLLLGLYDHWLLSYLLRPRPLEQAEARHG